MGIKATGRRASKFHATIE